MPRIAGTSNAQSKFIRAFRHRMTGPPPGDWPDPRVLKRWMRQPGFRRELAGIRSALELQAQVRLIAASIQAAQAPTAGQNLEVLKLSHQRERAGH
jgi:hypothetical protein